MHINIQLLLSLLYFDNHWKHQNDPYFQLKGLSVSTLVACLLTWFHTLHYYLLKIPCFSKPIGNAEDAQHHLSCHHLFRKKKGTRIAPATWATRYLCSHFYTRAPRVHPWHLAPPNPRSHPSLDIAFGLTEWAGRTRLQHLRHRPSYYLDCSLLCMAIYYPWQFEQILQIFTPISPWSVEVEEINLPLLKGLWTYSIDSFFLSTECITTWRLYVRLVRARKRKAAGVCRWKSYDFRCPGIMCDCCSFWP